MKSDLTPAMLRALRDLHYHREITYSLVGRSQHGGVYKTIGALKRRGLIEVVDNRLHVTQAGRQVIEAHRPQEPADAAEPADTDAE